MPSDLTLRPSPEAAAIPFDGGLVILDQRTSRLHAYNGAAGAIWCLVEAELDPGEASDVLSRTVGIPVARAAGDIAAMVEVWRGQGLIQGEEHAAERPRTRGFRPQALARAVSVRNYAIGGRRLRIGGDDPEVMAHVGAVLRAFEAEDSAPEHHLRAVWTARDPGLALLLDGVERLRVETPAEMVGAMFQLVLELVRPGVSWLALLHGAAVALEGRGVLLPGPSGSGKSTLAAHLSTRGFDYVCDDLIALQAPDGRVAPWPVPHSLKHGSWPVLAQDFPQLAEAAVDHIAGRDIKFVRASSQAWDQPPFAVQLIVFPRFQPAACAGIQALNPLEVLQRLMQDRVWLGHPLSPSSVQAFLAWLVKTPAFDLVYGELDQARRLVEEASKGANGRYECS